MLSLFNVSPCQMFTGPLKTKQTNYIFRSAVFMGLSSANVFEFTLPFHHCYSGKTEHGQDSSCSGVPFTFFSYCWSSGISTMSCRNPHKDWCLADHKRYRTWVLVFLWLLLAELWGTEKAHANVPHLKATNSAGVLS